MMTTATRRLPSAAMLLLISCYLFQTSSAWTSHANARSSRHHHSLLVRHVKEPKKPDMEQVDLTGGRPGAIIETEEQLARKEIIQKEIETGERLYPKWIDDYGELDEDEVGFDSDDPDAIDSSTLGVYDIFDLKSKFDYEWDPASGDPDPNMLDPDLEYVTQPEVDKDGIEVGWDPIFGPSNPIDERTIVTPVDSYMIADDTRDDSILEPVFDEGDLELEYNEEVVKFRKSLGIIETYMDPFLKEFPVPRHVAKWHGYPEQMSYPPKNYTNNRFTAPEDLTDFDSMTPYRARKRAVELARAKNCEWLPDGVSQKWHQAQREPYEKIGTLVGTLRKGDIDESILEDIQPALKVLGSIVDLLSIEAGTVFRFHYHGLIKNRAGMAAWTETLIKECGVECTGVVFETGFRRRDPAYDGGDPWFGPY